MNSKGPIIVVDDDASDEDVIRACIRDGGYTNDIRWFKNGQEAYDYLLKTNEQPFIIFADILMPVLNGLELLQRINETPVLHQKAIPFVYLTKALSREIVGEAFNLFAQGFFEKAGTYEAQKRQIICILEYWRHSWHPNNLP